MSKIKYVQYEVERLREGQWFAERTNLGGARSLSEAQTLFRTWAFEFGQPDAEYRLVRTDTKVRITHLDHIEITKMINYISSEEADESTPEA